MMENINLDDKNNTRIASSNIVAEAWQVHNVTHNLTFKSLLTSTQDKNAEKRDVSITLPRSVLKSGQRIHFFNFRDDGLFPVSPGTSPKYLINSALVSASIKDTEVRNLTEDSIVVEFTFKDASYANNCSCAYWDVEANEGFGNWARNVCVYEVVDETRGRCICDHLTHFALLVVSAI